MTSVDSSHCRRVVERPSYCGNASAVFLMARSIGRQGSLANHLTKSVAKLPKTLIVIASMQESLLTGRY